MRLGVLSSLDMYNWNVLSEMIQEAISFVYVLCDMVCMHWWYVALYELYGKVYINNILGIDSNWHYGTSYDHLRG